MKVQAGSCQAGGSPSPSPVVQKPDHISVNSDITTGYLCSIGASRRRLVNYNVVATDTCVVQTTISIRQTVDPSTYSSCNNMPASTSFILCVPIGSGNYTDALDPGCPPTSQLAQGCGFAFPDQAWQWCSPDGSTPVFGDIGQGLVNNTSISLGGNTEGYANGTTFPH